MNSYLTSIAQAVLNVVLVLAAAPLLEGVIRKVTARVQSRQGPPVWQPYFDLAKLLTKEDIESGEVPAVQRFAGYLSLAAILTVACFVPMGGLPPMGVVGDGILLIYLLTLTGVATLLAGFAAGSTYSILGASREMVTMLALEPLLAITIVVGAVKVQSLDLVSILNGSPYLQAGFPWAGIVMMLAVLFGLQAFVGRIPFDIAEAETEIMEGPLIEYSGPKLALFKYSQMAKLFVYCALFISLFAPWGNQLVFPLNLGILLVKVLILVLLVTLVAATHARLRIDQAIRYYATLLGVGFVALLLALFGK